jgi:hypothetical protein
VHHQIGSEYYDQAMGTIGNAFQTATAEVPRSPYYQSLSSEQQVVYMAEQVYTMVVQYYKAFAEDVLKGHYGLPSLRKLTAPDSQWEVKSKIEAALSQNPVQLGERFSPERNRQICLTVLEQYYPDIAQKVRVGQVVRTLELLNPATAKRQGQGEFEFTTLNFLSNIQRYWNSTTEQFEGPVLDAYTKTNQTLQQVQAAKR